MEGDRSRETTSKTAQHAGLGQVVIVSEPIAERIIDKLSPSPAAAPDDDESVDDDDDDAAAA